MGFQPVIKFTTGILPVAHGLEAHGTSNRTTKLGG